MSSIGQSGNLSQSGNTIFLSGGSSGLDTAALIEAAVKQRLREADKIDVRIDENLAKYDGYSTLQSLGSSLQSSLTALRKAYGFSSTDGSVYNQKAGTIATNNSVDPQSILGVNVTEDAAIGTNTIIVQNKAKSMRVASEYSADATAALGLNGDFDIRLENSSWANISVAAGDSLNSIAAKINAASGDSNVSAQVIKTSENEWQMVLTGLETGQYMQTATGAGDNILQAIGVHDGGGAYQYELQANENAQVLFNGVAVTRNSNVIDDLVEGVSLDIKNADPTTEITLDIGNDAPAVKDAIMNFVESYNALRDFVITNNQVSSDGTVSEDAVLYNDNIMKSLDSSLQGLFSINFVTGAQETLREIGIEFDPNNKLKVDEITLDNALLDDFGAVQALFQSQYSDDNAEFNITRNTSQNASLNFALDITHDGTNITNVSVGGDNSLFTVTGSTIKGNAGTIYEGLTFAYVGNTSTTVNVGFNQGFADLGANLLENFTNNINGTIQSEKLSIESQNENLDSRASRVRERAEAYRLSLIEKYARFESQLSAAKATINQIRAILGTNNDD